MSKPNGLLIRNTSGDEENMTKVQEVVEAAIGEVKALGDDYLSKLPPGELDVMINTKILDAVKALNIDGLSIVPANEAGLEMMEGTSAEDRARIREMMESMMSDGNMPGLQERTEAVHNIVMSLAKYAMSTAPFRNGPAEMFHDFGQIVANAITETASGAKQMAGPDDKMIPEASKMLNRIAFISALKMLLKCDTDQAERSSIDQAALREDIAAVLEDKGDDRIKAMIATLNDFHEVSKAKTGDKGSATLH
jgi:hypothetical protein